jgi:hypothetical protein
VNSSSATCGRRLLPNHVNPWCWCDCPFSSKFPSFYICLEIFLKLSGSPFTQQLQHVTISISTIEFLVVLLNSISHICNPFMVGRCMANSCPAKSFYTQRQRNCICHRTLFSSRGKTLSYPTLFIILFLLLKDYFIA